MEDTIYYRTTYAYYPAAFAIRLINIVIGVIEAFLAIRIVLELLAANAGSQFVAWMYHISGAFMGPFVGAFPNAVLGGAAVLDITAILAIFVYAVMGWIIALLLSVVFNAAAVA